MEIILNEEQRHKLNGVGIIETETESVGVSEWTRMDDVSEISN